MSSNGSANRSCRTKATRSAGDSVSSTTSIAGPTASESSTCSSGPASVDAWSRGTASEGSSRRERRDRSMSSETRATTVVSQPTGFCTSSAPARDARSQASCTASSASADEPRIRWATACRCVRLSSKHCGRSRSIGHTPCPASVIGLTDRSGPMSQDDEGVHMSARADTIIFPVTDLPKATHLFRALLGAEPVMDEPYYVGFRIDGQDIGLDPNGHRIGITGPVCYWEVEDIAAARQQLLDAGAT